MNPLSIPSRIQVVAKIVKGILVKAFNSFSDSRICSPLDDSAGVYLLSIPSRIQAQGNSV